MATTRNASKSIQNLKWFSVASLLKIAYLLRVLVTLMPSHGYVHPDEFFQSTEPMAVLLVGWKGNLTWEWTGQHPLRCAFFPYLLGQTVFKPLKAFFGDYPPPAYLIMVLPRLLFTLISFLSDAALGAMHRSGRLPHLQYTQLLHATSHVVFVYLTRTLTNSIEYLLYGWLLVLMIGSFGAKSRSRSLSNLSAALLATICTFGFWARPTFAAYALYPVIYWCIAPYRSNQRFWINVQSIIGRVFRLTCFALPIAIFLILFDTYYYRPEVIQQIIQSGFTHIPYRDWVLTPFNFIAYNSKSANVALHGVNWRGQHLAVNLPLLSLLLVIPFGVDSSKFISYLIRRTFCRFHKVTLPSSFKSPLRRLLFLSSWPPLLLLSAIPHQEPRFLLPLLIPFLVLYSSHAFVSRKRIAFWITLNTFLAAFYCFIHQSGVTRSLLHLQPLLHSDASDRHSTCTFFHTYLPPQHLLAIPNHMSTIDFHDLSQQTEVTAIDSLFPQLNSSGHHFLVSPGSVRAALQLVASKSNIRLQPVRTFFPTFNFESLRWPSSIDHNQLQSLFSTDIWRLHFTTLTN